MTTQEQSAESDQYVIEVKWNVPGLPGLIGPFPTQAEAEDWGALNIPNGTWNVSPLAWPYMRSRHRTRPGVTA